MKKLILLVALSFIGCQTDTDEYYVKYSIDSYHYQLGHKLELILNDENEERLDLLVNVREQVETTIGPVPYGFNASMLARDDGGNHTYELDAEILVSKNGGPFSLKAIDGSEDSRSYVLLEYTIDF
jgi:hypothetical protein